MTTTTRPDAPMSLPPPPQGRREAPPVGIADLFVGFFRRDLHGFFPQSRFEPVSEGPARSDPASWPGFRLVEGAGGGPDAVEMFGVRYAIAPRSGGRFSAHDRRLIRSIGAVLNLRYLHAFRAGMAPRLELFRGGSEDHYVAAFVEPSAYAEPSTRPSRIAATIHTLRTAALSTYENRRVSTGALLLGPGDDPDHPARPTPPDALTYGVELTALKSIHRLCDGRRTLFLVDPDGKLASIVDITRWAGPAAGAGEVPCARAYTPHARATRAGGHVCLVLSPNQEIKLFADGVQAFAFAHGRWRVLDPRSKYAVWRAAVADERVARALFQTALDLAEHRQGGLFVVADAPGEAVGRLVAPHDLLDPDGAAPSGPPPELMPGDPLAKRALHYLARGAVVTALDPPVLEALAGLDGALVTDRAGRLLAFAAILRHDPATLPGPVTAEGARTTAALAASHFGPVLKVSEDGLVSCFLHGARVWDL
jgi:hypothetical protein